MSREDPNRRQPDSLDVGPDGQEAVSIRRSVLQHSRRVAQESAPMIRGEVTETPEESLIEIPLPVALGEDAKPVRILHVDDDPEIANVTSMFLERINDDFQVISETTVVGALDHLRDETVDCIISDYEMPNTDGLEFLEIVLEELHRLLDAVGVLRQLGPFEVVDAEARRQPHTDEDDADHQHVAHEVADGAVRAGLTHASEPPAVVDPPSADASRLEWRFPVMVALYP